jgi:hypothetical protein
MNMQKKIQIVSAGVIANSALALGLFWALPASASCSDPGFSECLPPSICSTKIAADCAARKPAGCTVAGTQCIPHGIGCGADLGVCSYF